MPGLGAPGLGTVVSYAPRHFLLTGQGAVIVAGKIGATARDAYGATPTTTLRAGTVLGFATTTKAYYPLKGAEIATAAAVGSNVLYVNCATQFAVGDNIYMNKPAQTKGAGLSQNCGAALSVYATSKTITVTTALISAAVTGDFVYTTTAGATTDGTEIAAGILAETVDLLNDAGSAAAVEAQIVKAGFVKTKSLLGLSAKAKQELAGRFQDALGTAFSFDDNAV